MLPCFAGICALSDDNDQIDGIPEKLPLDTWHRARGARMVPFAGYAMPIQFAGIVAEHEWTRNSASLFDVSHMGQISIIGDAAAFEVEKLVPGAITTLAQERVRYSLLLDENGGVLDDLMITSIAGGVFLIVNGAVKHDDLAHLHAHLSDAVTVEHHQDWALLALQGPKAAAVLAQLLPGAEELPFMHSADFEWQQASVKVSRSGYTGEDGFEISVPAHCVASLADALLADERVKPAGLGARDTLRLEAGLPLYGTDLTRDIDPVSAGLTFALSKRRLTDGGWLGHQAIQGILADGPQRLRVGLALDGRLPARGGAPVYCGAAQIGSVTSGTFSPTLERPIAMAFVDAAQAATGTQVEIEVRGKRIAATVTPLPFVPHKYFRGN